jgi:hypothetical protein
MPEMPIKYIAYIFFLSAFVVLVVPNKWVRMPRPTVVSDVPLTNNQSMVSASVKPRHLPLGSDTPQLSESLSLQGDAGVIKPFSGSPGKPDWSCLSRIVKKHFDDVEQFPRNVSQIPEGVVWCDHLERIDSNTFKADATGDSKPEIWTWNGAGAHSLYLTVSDEGGDELGCWFTDGGFSCVHLEDGTPLVAIRNRDLDDPIESEEVQLYRFEEFAIPDPWVAVCPPFRLGDLTTYPPH